MDPVPLHLRNPVTGLMRETGYGKGYKYAHDFPEHYVEQQHLPESLKDRRYYEPGDQGFESEIKSRLDKWRKARSEARTGEEPAGPE